VLHLGHGAVTSSVLHLTPSWRALCGLKLPIDLLLEPFLVHLPYMPPHLGGVSADPLTSSSSIGPWYPPVRPRHCLSKPVDTVYYSKNPSNSYNKTHNLSDAFSVRYSHRYLQVVPLQVHAVWTCPSRALLGASRRYSHRYVTSCLLDTHQVLLTSCLLDTTMPIR
jgi:hypothetical protein